MSYDSLHKVLTEQLKYAKDLTPKQKRYLESIDIPVQACLLFSVRTVEESSHDAFTLVHCKDGTSFFKFALGNKREQRTVAKNLGLCYWKELSLVLAFARTIVTCQAKKN
jgi:hypothetical protein